MERISIRVAVILNGISGKKGKFKRHILPQLEANFSVDLFETLSAGDAFQFAAEAVSQQYDVILAAGGDGTLHQVLNGMLSGNEERTELPVLGLIPIGTGNDFARTMQLKKDPATIVELIRNKKFKIIAVGKVYYNDMNTADPLTRYFINVADAGMGPEVVKRIDQQRSFLGIPYSYYVAILKTFYSYRLINVKAVTTGWSWQGKTRAIAVANGKFFGQGLCIAPEAKPDDRLFSTFICADVSVLDFIRYTIPLKQGKEVHHPQVHYGSCEAMELTSDSPCGIEADGEFLGMLPARIEMIKNQIRFLG